MSCLRLSDCDKLCIVVCDMCSRIEFESNVHLDKDNMWTKDDEYDYCPICTDRYKPFSKKE